LYNQKVLMCHFMNSSSNISDDMKALFFINFQSCQILSTVKTIYIDSDAVILLE